MNEMMVFEGNNVEVFEIDGIIFFNPYHVGVCLGIENKTAKNHMAEMDSDEVVKLKNSDARLTGFRKLNNAGENFLTEEGVYALIFKSRKPEALKFQKWVTKEVLPALRKTGTYSMGKKTEKEKLPTRSKVAADLRANILIAKQLGAKGNQAILSGNRMTSTQYKEFGINPLLESGLELEAEDKVQYFTPTQLAKKIGTTARKFNKALEDAGFQEEMRDHKNRLAWAKTRKANKFCAVLDTTKRNSNGAPVTQLKWAEDVVDELMTA